jgi:hypothetical protein
MIAKRWSSGRTAWIVGLIGALYVPMILESGILYTETVYTFFLTAAVGVILLAMEDNRHRIALYAGIGFVLAGLSREIGFYSAFAASTFISIRRKSFFVMVVLMVPSFFAVSGMYLRNREVALQHHVQKVPVVAKNFGSQLMERGYMKKVLTPSASHFIGVYKFFRFPFRLLDISSGTNLKDAVMNRDWVVLGPVWMELATKSILVFYHMLILTLALLGALKGALKCEAKIVFCLVIGVACATIIVGSIGRWRRYDTFEPLARYRFPVEPLILILAASGAEWWSRRRETGLTSEMSD